MALSSPRCGLAREESPVTPVDQAFLTEPTRSTGSVPQRGSSRPRHRTGNEPAPCLAAFPRTVHCVFHDTERPISETRGPKQTKRSRTAWTIANTGRTCTRHWQTGHNVCLPTTPAVVSRLRTRRQHSLVPPQNSSIFCGSRNSNATGTSRAGCSAVSTNGGGMTACLAALLPAAGQTQQHTLGRPPGSPGTRPPFSEHA